MKKGISLIVLVITIIVMIILAASVVITLSNTGVINKASQAVDLTNERQVQDLAALVWADEFMAGKRGEMLKEAVLDKLEDYTTDYIITVTDSGISVSKTPTLGELISNPETDYGKMVDYSANGVDEWQVYYEDEVNGYVFLMAKDSIGELNNDVSIDSYTFTAAEENLYKIFKLGSDEFIRRKFSFYNSRFSWRLF